MRLKHNSDWSSVQCNKKDILHGPCLNEKLRNALPQFKYREEN